MLNKLILFFVFFSLSAFADTVTVNPDAPEKYVVKKGDTLWDISGRFLAEPWYWPEVWRANPQIENPHLIYPGDVVSLRYQDGKPILYVDRGDTTSDRYLRLSPEIRSYPRDEAIPAIPVDAIQQFLSRPLIVTEEQMEDWPYVVSSYDEHLVAGTGNTIYVRGLPEDASNKRYAIYRKGDPYYRAVDAGKSVTRYTAKRKEGTVLGYEALYVGDAVIEKEGDPASAVIANANREILVGDRLAIESDADINTNFVPHPPVREINGNVISVIDGVSEIGQYQVVVLDVGSNDGLEVGNIVGVYKAGEIAKDYVASRQKAKRELEEGYDCGPEPATIPCEIVKGLIEKKRKFDQTPLAGYLGRPSDKPVEVRLPEEYAGVLMVFRTFDNLSYALVMEAESAIHLYDSVRNL